jgi:catechol 2,3-dioxygenase-like lactoylglutathione lyase family enzyme
MALPRSDTLRPEPPISDPAARAASPGTGGAPADGWAALVPELGVSDIRASLAFWCEVLGFTVTFDRPAARFAYLGLGRVQVMLCEVNGRWETAALTRPFGRGINLEMRVRRIAPLVDALERAGWPLFEAPAEAWYRVGEQEAGQREFLVQDPDGYLLRFTESLGSRVPPAA